MYPKDRNHIMPVITPSYPQINSTFNVIRSTLNIIRYEMLRGAHDVTSLATIHGRLSHYCLFYPFKD